MPQVTSCKAFLWQSVINIVLKQLKKSINEIEYKEMIK